MLCINCKKPLTDIPKVVGEAKKCSCGISYFIEVGDAGDIIESLIYAFDIESDDLIKKNYTVKENKNRLEFTYKSKRAIAILVDPSEDFIHTWIVFRF